MLQLKCNVIFDLGSRPTAGGFETLRPWRLANYLFPDLPGLGEYIMNQSESEGYFDDIYLSSLKKKSPVLKRVLLNFYGFFACLWQKIVK